MLDNRIILAGLWVALMLIYLLGDVLRIFSGDVARMGGTQHLSQGMHVVREVRRVVHAVAFTQPLEHLGVQRFDDQHIHGKAGFRARRLRDRGVPQ